MHDADETGRRINKHTYTLSLSPRRPVASPAATQASPLARLWPARVAVADNGRTRQLVLCVIGAYLLCLQEGHHTHSAALRSAPEGCSNTTGNYRHETSTLKERILATVFMFQSRGYACDLLK